MLFETASSAISLLVFSILVPMGVTAMGLVGLVRASLGLDEEAAKKADTLLSVPAVVTIVGLIASFTHLGSPFHVFGMVSGIGSSPLSKEIVIAGMAILVALVYWIFTLVKHPEEAVHKVFGIALVVLGLICALFTGLAYMIPTIVTWNSPVGAISQVCAALFGGAVLAALVLALANAKVDKALGVCALVGAAGVAVMLLVQGGLYGGVVNAAGLTLSAVMGQYWVVAVIAIVCAAVAAFLVFKNAAKDGAVTMMAVAAVAALIALVLVRICFYGIFLSVGLF